MPAVVDTRASLITERSVAVATDRPRMRKAAPTPTRKLVKTSVLVDAELHARWSAAASLRGMSNTAYAVEALTESLRGLVIIDRRKSAGRVESSQQEGSADAA